MKPGMKYSLFTALTMLLLAGAIIAYQYLTSVITIPTDSSQELPSVSDNTEGGEKEKSKAPDFTVTDKEGKEFRLSDNFGRPIILNFWASWCPPCRSEMPVFEKLYGQYGTDVVFMMVNLTDGYRETANSVKDFLSETGYTFPVCYDIEEKAAKAYNVSSIPLTVAIDKNGNVYKTHLGTINETSLEKLIQTLLEGK